MKPNKDWMALQPFMCERIPTRIGPRRISWSGGTTWGAKKEHHGSLLGTTINVVSTPTDSRAIIIHVDDDGRINVLVVAAKAAPSILAGLFRQIDTV